MDVERDEEAEPQGGWEWVKTQEEKRKKEREEVWRRATCWSFLFLFGFSEFPLAYGFCIIGVESSSLFARFSRVEWFPAFSTVDVGGTASNITFSAF